MTQYGCGLHWFKVRMGSAVLPVGRARTLVLSLRSHACSGPTHAQKRDATLGSRSGDCQWKRNFVSHTRQFLQLSNLPASGFPVSSGISIKKVSDSTVCTSSKSFDKKKSPVTCRLTLFDTPTWSFWGFVCLQSAAAAGPWPARSRTGATTFWCRGTSWRRSWGSSASSKVTSRWVSTFVCFVVVFFAFVVFEVALDDTHWLIFSLCIAAQREAAQHAAQEHWGKANRLTPWSSVAFLICFHFFLSFFALSPSTFSHLRSD